jgi:hypothetical protein
MDLTTAGDGSGLTTVGTRRLSLGGARRALSRAFPGDAHGEIPIPDGVSSEAARDRARSTVEALQPRRFKLAGIPVTVARFGSDSLRYANGVRFRVEERGERRIVSYTLDVSDLRIATMVCSAAPVAVSAVLAFLRDFPSAASVLALSPIIAIGCAAWRNTMVGVLEFHLRRAVSGRPRR